MILAEKPLPIEAKDLKTALEVKWCAGCGDHAILAALQRAMPALGVAHEDLAVVSGIGCSSRLPYYLNTYGFHSIHGRASAIASGLKVANPKLSVWQVGGDGDMLAIGGNHFIHAVRRNIDMNVVLFNNEIYGLTKGQYSPTTKRGEITKTSPFGTIENPFNAGQITIGASGNFFARATDTNIKHLTDVCIEAGKYKGTSVIEVLQNCVIFNHGTHDLITDKETRDDMQLLLEHGKPMIFGKEREKGIVLEGFKLKAVKIGEGGYTEKDILVHDAKCEESAIHTMLVQMKGPHFPVALGVIRSYQNDTYEDLLDVQNAEVQSRNLLADVNALFASGDTWTI